MGSKTTQSNEPAITATPLITKIKKEVPEFEIKEYAENAMKEMLGWYGYERGGGSSSDTSSEPENGTGVGSSMTLRRKSLKESSPQPQPNIPAGCMCCAWCQKVSNAKQFNFKTPSGKAVFCSEQCFTQCRRANFKRNKTCDWCRHVRHTVNYVDFQDGDHQLQFCSDKCLNQYKMNIFCKETQAHLELHPHLRDGPNSGQGSSDSTGTAGNLITPELWMRDCRSQSPDTDRSTTPPRIPSPLVEIKTSPKRNRNLVISEKKSSRDGIKKKMVRIRRAVKVDHSSSSSRVDDHRRSPGSPHSSPGSVSPPKVHLQPPPPIGQPIPLPPPPPHHFLSDRPLFFQHGIIPSPHHIYPDVRFAGGSQRLPPRTSQAQHIPPPPLLPINRPLQPPLFPFLSSSPLLPPPTTIVPYPIFLPIPVPIPIPIPLPGVKISDLSSLGENETQGSDLPSQSSKENSNTGNISNRNINNNNNNDNINNNDSNKDNNSTPAETTPPDPKPSTKLLQTLPPPRKRKRIIEISQESGSIRNTNSVHA